MNVEQRDTGKIFSYSEFLSGVCLESLISACRRLLVCRHASGPVWKTGNFCPRACPGNIKKMTMQIYCQHLEDAGEGRSAAWPKVSGKTAFFPRNDSPYGLKRAAFQTENAPELVASEKGKTREPKTK